MEVRLWWGCCLRLIVVATAASTWWQQVYSQPQIDLLDKGCNQFNATDIPNFFSNLTVAFSGLRTQLMSGGARGRPFATAQRDKPFDPVYAMVQCRKYMSEPDCLACYDAAVSEIRSSCPASDGARVTYDGCFLRYESNNFFNQTTFLGDLPICNQSASPAAAAFGVEGDKLLRDLEAATPRISGYFTAAKRRALNSTIYGVAQCIETISQSGCQDCLAVVYENIRGCLPYTDARAIAASCFLRYSVAPFFADNQTTDIAQFLKRGENSSKKKAVLGGVAGGAGVILILVALLLWCKTFSRKPKENQRGSILGVTELRGPNIYIYKDLKDATNNFSAENKLGEGGFGDVYKATMKNGNIVAVKRLNISRSRAREDFETEVRLISNVHHRNLVRLLGLCSKASQLLLVYEYMANGSLDRFLFGEKRGTLTWKQRFDIIFGIARGLAYLHEQYHVCIIHRDIKPGNILLDNDVQAKIADFGMVRLLPENQSHVSTKFAGTLGYTAPEYAIHGHLSEKVDIYSFGVVILEIISGRRNSDLDEDFDSDYLLEEAWKLYDSGMHQNLADKSLDPNDCNPDQVKKMVEIALLCIQSPASSRPTMSEILVMLLSDLSLGHTRAPIRHTFGYRMVNRFVREANSTSTGSSNSNATASISHFTGR